MFGHRESKKTCLWLKNLPLLEPTNQVEPEERIYAKSGKSHGKWWIDTWKLPPE